MKEQIPLKYACLDRMQDIVKNCKDDDAAKLIIELYDLIAYQRTIIKEQRIEIVAIKHQKAWVRYDRSIEEYDTNTRSYIDKPAKSGNMSC